MSLKEISKVFSFAPSIADGGAFTPLDDINSAALRDCSVITLSERKYGGGATASMSEEGVKGPRYDHTRYGKN